MEPLKPATARQILATRPQAAPQDIEEYERLLAERFAEDPDVPAAPGDDRRAKRDARLRELQQKLFSSTKTTP